MGLHTNWHKTKIQNIGTGVAPRTVHIEFHRAVTSAAVGVPSPSFYRDSGY